jgi:TFIIF-interacting CTD phosphatase-like protein
MKKVGFFLFGNVFAISGYVESKKNSSNKLNLIFDLDETILFTEKSSRFHDYNPQNLLQPDYKNEDFDRYVWTRPFVQQIIPVLSKFNNLFLFTKAKQEYTDSLLQQTHLNQYFQEKKYRTVMELVKIFRSFNKSRPRPNSQF